MEGHSNKRCADEYSEVQTDLGNVETPKVGHDEKEDTDRRKMDQHCDDPHDDDLNFLDRTHQSTPWLDHVADHDGRYKYGQQTVRCERVDDVLRNERVEHVDYDLVDSDLFAFIDGLLVVCVCDFELVWADSDHELGPDEANE